MNTTTIHPAEAYLRNSNNPSSLYVKINGSRRRLFINRQEGVIGIIAERKKRKGYRFDFCGYDGTLWCEPREDGDMASGFMKEYRNTGNGYYYLLINDNTMIDYDID